MAKWSTTVECKNPLDVNVSISGQVILDTSKLKTVIPCAPAKIGGGFKIGGSGKSNIQGEATAQADFKDKMIQGNVAGVVGVGGGGTIQGGGFALWDEKIVGADGEIQGTAMVRGKTVYKADAGVNEGRSIFNTKKMLKGAGKTSGVATLSIATDRDALAYVDKYGSPSDKNKSNKTDTKVIKKKVNK